MYTKFKNQSKKAFPIIYSLSFISICCYVKKAAIYGKIDKERTYTAIQVLLFISISFLYPVQAQEVRQESGHSAITIGYFGETITHPGLFAGYEHNLMPQKRYQLLLALNLGGYIHQNNHTGLFSEVGIGQRFNFRSGFLLEQYVGMGYLHTFLNGGPIYEVNDNGVVSETSNKGRSHVMPSVSLGLGWNLARSKKLPLLVFVRPRVFWQYPFNSYALPHVALQVGITKVIR
ncbi:MAG TPA: hypothetical protein VF677_09890 [Flavobacterium sp.]|jgi:hypothetical protein